MVNILRSNDCWSLLPNLGASINDIRTDGVDVSGPLDPAGLPNVFNIFNLQQEYIQNSETGW